MPHPSVCWYSGLLCNQADLVGRLHCINIDFSVVSLSHGIADISGLTHWHRVTHMYVIGAKPLPEPRMTSCQLHPRYKLRWNKNENETIFMQDNFHTRKFIWKWCLQNIRHFCLNFTMLTHWGRVTHIYVSILAIIGSNNGLSPGRRQAIIWINAGKLLIGPLGTKFSEISIEIHTFSFRKMHLKMLSAKYPDIFVWLQYVNPGIDLCTHRQSCKPIWETQDLWIPPAVPEISWFTFPKACKRLTSVEYNRVAPGNPTLWRGVPVASIQKTFGSSGRDWKPWKKLPIRCKFCPYRFIRYSSTCYGKVRINPLMAFTRNPDFFASPVASAAWFVVVRPCYLNRDLLSGPKRN